MRQNSARYYAVLLSGAAFMAVFSVAAFGAAADHDGSYIIADTALTAPHAIARVAGVTTTTALKGKVITSGDGLFYYLGQDNKRYFIPTPDAPNTPGGPDIVANWYGDRTQVVTIGAADRNSYALGGNATIRPGTNLIKIDTSPKVYAITPGGVIHWVSTSTLLSQLYGANWSTRVVVIPDAYFINYTSGSDITSAAYPDSTLIQFSGSSDVYLLREGRKRKFVGEGFTANHYQTKFIVTNVDASAFVYPDGTPITGLEAGLTTLGGPIVNVTTPAPTPTPTPTPAPTSHDSTSPNTEPPHDEPVTTTPPPPATTTEPTTSTTTKPPVTPSLTNTTDFQSLAHSITTGNVDNILTELKTLRDRVKELETENKYLKGLTQGVPAPSADAQSSLNDFITYGVDPNTKALGAGERAAVLNSYKAAFGKLPQTENELADTIKIANGRWPSEQSPEAEARAKESFVKVYGRSPDSTNVHDNAAVTIMAYGLRQSAVHRNLKSEASAAVIFKHIFGHLPSTTEEWNILQAIAYSGATHTAPVHSDQSTTQTGNTSSSTGDNTTVQSQTTSSTTPNQY